jgi:hypothetical protein
MRRISIFALLLAAVAFARPAAASSITVLVGDKDWFGTNLPYGSSVPWNAPPNPLYDGRSVGETGASNGAQLTDLYSALFFDYPCSPSTDPGCSPNKDTGSVFFPFSGILQSGSISMLMGDFEATTWGPMTVDINGVPIPFDFEDGFQQTAFRTFALTPSMIAAANADGVVRLTFDHRGAYGDSNIDPWGSFDYVAFDYFEMNAEVAPVPEPGTMVLVGLGLAGSFLAARRRLRV